MVGLGSSCPKAEAVFGTAFNKRFNGPSEGMAKGDATWCYDHLCTDLTYLSFATWQTVVRDANISRVGAEVDTYT